MSKGNRRHILVITGLIVALWGAGAAAWQALASEPNTQGWSAAPRAATWQTEIADLDGGVEPSLALDSSGHPHVSYAGNQAGTFIYGLKYAVHDGTAWQIEMVDEDVAPGWETSLALDALGRPHIAYHEAHEALRYAHHDGSSWTIDIVDSGGDVGEDASLALDSAGQPRIAYSDITSMTIRYASLVGTEWQTETVTSMPDAMRINLDLALDSLDRPRLCYYRDTGSGASLEYAYFDGSAWQYETIDDGIFYNGQDCSLALDSQDRPHISYRDLGLLYAHDNGTAWQIMTVDDDFFAGDDSSLALDSHDRPHIAYTDWDTDELLQYASAAIGWQMETVDVAAETSRYEGVSLQLGADDQPRVAYRDLTPDDLKYAVRGELPVACRITLPLVVK